MSSSRSESLSAVFILIVSIWIIFGRLLLADFTSWDDYGTLSRNPHFNPPSINTAIYYIEHQHMNLYVPVTYAVWTFVAMIAYDSQAKSLDASYFHAASLVLHTIASLLAFNLLRRIIGRVWPACLGAMIFALHPIQTESLGWTSGLKDVLAWTLSLAAISMAIAWLDRGKSWRVILASTLFVLALLSKPSTVVTPLMFLVIAWLTPESFQPLKRAAMLALSWLIISFACIIWSRQLQPKDIELIHPTLLQRPLIVLDTISFYITKIIWPHPLTFDYGHRPQSVLNHAPESMQIVLPILVIVVFSILMMLKKIDWRIVTAGTAFALLGITPVLGIVSFDMQQYSTVADHYPYGSMVGIGLIVTALVSCWRKLMLPGAMWVGLLAIISFNQTSVWMDSQSLFRHGLLANPNSWPSHQSLAATLVEEANDHPARREAMLAEAERLAQRAVEIDPNFRLASITLANARAARGDLAGAIRAAEQGVKHRPDSAPILATLAGLYGQAGQLDRSVETARQAVKIDAKNIDAWNNLGTALAQQGHLSEARGAYLSALAVDPNQPVALQNLRVITQQIEAGEKTAPATGPIP